MTLEYEFNNIDSKQNLFPIMLYWKVQTICLLWYVLDSRICCSMLQRVKCYNAKPKAIPGTVMAAPLSWSIDLALMPRLRLCHGRDVRSPLTCHHITNMKNNAYAQFMTKPPLPVFTFHASTVYNAFT